MEQRIHPGEIELYINTGGTVSLEHVDRPGRPFVAIIKEAKVNIKGLSMTVLARYADPEDLIEISWHTFVFGGTERGIRTEGIFREAAALKETTQVSSVDPRRGFNRERYRQTLDGDLTGGIANQLWAVR